MSSSDSPPVASEGAPELSLERLPADLRAALEDRWREAARQHRSLALSLPDFAADVLRLWHRGRVRKGLASDAAALREDIDRVHHVDLFLARMCERGDEYAWRVLTERYEPDLRQVLLRHTSADAAEDIASAVLAEVALPPARKPDRTLLGTYEGSGPLWAWLATIGLRRMRKGWKRRDASLESIVDVGDAPRASEDESDEATQRFCAALRAAWQALEPREALALAYKHHHGCSQREVARLLDTSAPTVTRILQRALAKVRGQLKASAPDLLDADAATWTRMERALSIHFETHADIGHRGMDAS